jgi:hypothetical protein
MARDMSSRSLSKLALSAVGVLTLLSSLAIATPASAAVFDCTSNKARGWANGSYTGSRYDRTASTSSYGGANNTFTSLANATTLTSRWYNAQGYSGTPLVRGPGGVAEDLFWLGYNDNIESMSLI